jgi:hypothetical protein
MDSFNDRSIIAARKNSDNYGKRGVTDGLDDLSRGLSSSAQADDSVAPEPGTTALPSP